MMKPRKRQILPALIALFSLVAGIPETDAQNGTPTASGPQLNAIQTAVPFMTITPDSRAGALSCLTGIAARKSIEEKRTVRIDELVSF